MDKIICGKVTLFREKCPDCGEYNLSHVNKFKCESCDYVYTEQKIDITRVLATTRRKSIPYKIKSALLIKQEHKCAYCGQLFGIHIFKNGKVQKLTIHADHRLPYSLLQSNPDENWVLSCGVCNLWKGSKIFESIEDTIKFMAYKWDYNTKMGKIELIEKTFE